MAILKVHQTKKTRRVLRRLSVLLLACGLCIPLLLASGSAAGSAVNVLADSTVKVWEWKRVYTQSDLPESSDFAVMLLYEDGGKQYMVDGNAVYKDSNWDDNARWFKLLGVDLPRGVVFGNDVCLTLEPVSHMRMSYIGRNEKNGQPKEYKWYADGISGRIGHLNPLKFNRYFVAEGSEYYFSAYADFCVQTSEIAFSEGYPQSGRVMLYDEIGGGVNDCPVFVSGNTVYALNSASTNMAQFIMYVGKEVEYSAVTHDVTVQSGQVQNVDGHVYVCPDVTITVEPGAVLSIQGNLYNNGYIYNQGDVVLQKNACIQTLLLEGDGGAICCDGGDLILMSGARMATGTCGYSGQYGNGFLMKNGATCTNYGTIILPANGRLESGAVLDNRKNGWLLQGYQVPSSREGTLHKFTQPQLRYSALESTFSCVYVEPLRQYFFSGSVTSLHLGDDTLALNQGTILMNGALQTESDAELRHEGGGLLDTTLAYKTYLNYLNRVYP